MRVGGRRGGWRILGRGWNDTLSLLIEYYVYFLMIAYGRLLAAPFELCIYDTIPDMDSSPYSNACPFIPASCGFSPSATSSTASLMI